MLRRSITYLLAIGAVSALLTLSPPAAHAIPVAGDYEFTSGLTGTFTSDGSRLTMWNFQMTGSPVIWADTNPIQTVELNDYHHYAAYQGVLGGDSTHAFLYWHQTDRFFQQAEYIAGSLNSVTFLEFTYQPTSAVPEPSVVVLLSLGLLALMGYVSQQQRQAGVQVE